jgi:nicotinamide riboside kinase
MRRDWLPDMAKSLLIIGAESTGKSTLARALGAGLGGLVVPERLRLWCIEHGRTPDAREQSRIIEAQQNDLLAAQEVCQSREIEWVILDSGPVMTAAYSEFYFGDTSLWPIGSKSLASITVVVWCRPSGIWVADPGLRDGPEVQGQVDEVLAKRMAPLVDWSSVHGDQTRKGLIDQIQAFVPCNITVEFGCVFHDTKPYFE